MCVCFFTFLHILYVPKESNLGRLCHIDFECDVVTLILNVIWGAAICYLRGCITFCSGHMNDKQVPPNPVAIAPSKYLLMWGLFIHFRHQALLT